MEPQDPNRYHMMINKQQETVMAIAEMNQSLPKEFEEEANKSLQDLANFRAEIDQDMELLEQQAEKIKAKFADKIHQEGLHRGFLMATLQEYENCLSFDRRQLNKLLQEDQDIWTVNMQEAQQRAKLAQSRIQGFLEKQQADLLAFLKRNELTTIALRDLVQLRKLPLWGVTDVQENEINFEWPKKSDMDQHNLKKLPELTQIAFYFKDSNTVCLRAIRFTHTNNFKSPLFDTGDAINCQIKIEQPLIKKTTRVSACCRETQRDSIKSVMFGDDNGSLAEINHYKREIGVQLPTYHLNPGEEIIGGYGVSNQQRFITSFGFIVLKRSL